MRLSVQKKWLLAASLTALILLILRAMVRALQYFHNNVAMSSLSIIQVILVIASVIFLIIGWFIILQKYQKEKKTNDKLSDVGFRSFKSSVVLSVLTILFILLPFPKFSSKDVMQNRTSKLQNIKQINNKQQCEIPSKSIAGKLNGGMKSDSSDTLNVSHLFNGSSK